MKSDLHNTQSGLHDMKLGSAPREIGRHDMRSALHRHEIGSAPDEADPEPYEIGPHKKTAAFAMTLIAFGASLAACGGNSADLSPVRLTHSPPIGQLTDPQLRALSMECEKYSPNNSMRGRYDAAYCEAAIAAWADAPLQMVPIEANRSIGVPTAPASPATPAVSVTPAAPTAPASPAAPAASVTPVAPAAPVAPVAPATHRQPDRGPSVD